MPDKAFDLVIAYSALEHGVSKRKCYNLFAYPTCHKRVGLTTLV
jgi:hypothetical protein